MRFAIVDKVRTLPLPGLKGFCPGCGAPVTPKCGALRVHHWSHRAQRLCDRWWEPETEWHRQWKLHFPEDAQEVILHDQNGERHIADVRTALGLTIEFQHSHIKPEERISRERFYGNLLWVVDGSRLAGDFKRFIEGSHSLIPAAGKGIYLIGRPQHLFPRTWLDSRVPVLIDFSGCAPVEGRAKSFAQALWCLLPGRIGGSAVVVGITHLDFIRRATEMEQPIQSQAILMHVANWITLVDRSRRARSRQLPQLGYASRQKSARGRNPQRRRF